MVDSDTGELIEKTLEHEGEGVRKFYSALPSPVLVGIEATGSMHWFLELLEELGIECRVGHPAKIRKAEIRKQKHDRRDARLLLDLLVENRFPAIISYLADFPKWRQLFQMHKLAVIVGDVRELRLTPLVYFRVPRHLGGALAVPYQAAPTPLTENL
jgi:hypothetical protein